MNHLEYIEVEPSRLMVGAHQYLKDALTWSTYLDSWSMVDRGEHDITRLPLYKVFKPYYSILPHDRKLFEQKLLNLPDCTGKTIAQEWVKRHIALYHSIKDEGYLPERRKTPIQVNITDDGELKLRDGHHTVSILRHLKNDSPIRVKVNERSGGWITLKNELYKMYGKTLLYQPVNHPDMKGWKVDRECEDRWKRIEPYLGDLQGKQVLDIGSNMGWFCERFTDMGAVVTGVDTSSHRVKAAKVFSKYHGYKRHSPTYIHTPVETYLPSKLGDEIDVTLMLSLLHHYIRRQPRSAWALLNLISSRSKRLILELGVNNLPIEWSPELVLEHSNYTRFTVLSDAKRPMYLYEK